MLSLTHRAAVSTRQGQLVNYISVSRPQKLGKRRAELGPLFPRFCFQPVEHPILYSMSSFRFLENAYTLEPQVILRENSILGRHGVQTMLTTFLGPNRNVEGNVDRKCQSESTTTALVV